MKYAEFLFFLFEINYPILNLKGKIIRISYLIELSDGNVILEFTDHRATDVMRGCHSKDVVKRILGANPKLVEMLQLPLFKLVNNGL